MLQQRSKIPQAAIQTRRTQNKWVNSKEKQLMWGRQVVLAFGMMFMKLKEWFQGLGTLKLLSVLEEIFCLVYFNGKLQQKYKGNTFEKTKTKVPHLVMCKCFPWILGLANCVCVSGMMYVFVWARAGSHVCMKSVCPCSQFTKCQDKNFPLSELHFFHTWKYICMLK